MPDPQGPPRDEAFHSFDARLDALATSQRRGSGRPDMESGAGAGYRLIGELVGGVLTGLGLGWVVDRFAGAAPWGLMGGRLRGTGTAICLGGRSAGSMSGAAAAQAGAVPPAAEPLDRNGDAP